MFSSSGLTTTFALIFALAFSLSELPLDFPDFNDFSSPDKNIYVLNGEEEIEKEESKDAA